MPTRAIKPSRLMYVLPALILGIGHLILFLSLVKFMNAFKEADSCKTENGISIPGQASFAFTEPGGYSVCWERSRDIPTEGLNEPDKKGLTVRITCRKTGNVIPLVPRIYGWVHYSDQQNVGCEMWTCQIAEPGAYDVRTSYPGGSRDRVFRIQIIKEPTSNMACMFRALWTGVPIFLIAYFLAAGVFAWIFLGRKKSKRLLEKGNA